MRRDAFSDCHPAVNMVFFLCTIALEVTIQHPAYLLAGFLSAGSYYLLLQGRNGLKLIVGLLPLFILLTAFNPFLNQQGSIILFTVWSRKYTLEALLYGAAISSVLVVMLLWFGCYNAVMTSDKFTSLFGRLIPSLSLLFVMVLRLVPALLRKASQITGALASIGKGVGVQNSKKERLTSGMNVLSALTAWALESSVTTADSMRSRGYGTGRNSSYQIYRMKKSDWVILVMQVILVLVVAATAFAGGTKAAFTPEFEIASLGGKHLPGFLAYCIYLLIPAALHIREDILWHILRSKI